MKGTFRLIIALVVLGSVALCQLAPAPISDDLLIPFRKGAKWGFSDLSRKIVIPPTYDRTSFFSEGLARVKKGDKYGYIDRSGKIVVQPTWLLSGDFSDGRAMIYEKSNYGFIDPAGKVIVTASFKEVAPFTDGRARVRFADRKFGFIDTNGVEISKRRYDDASMFSEGLAVVRVGADGDENPKYGYIDTSGTEVIPLEYQSAASFADGVAQVSKRSETERRFMYYSGFIDKFGKTVIPFEYGWSPWVFSEGLAFVNRKDIAEDQIIDIAGNVVLKNTAAYNIAGTEFHGGLARVSLGKKIGYIDRTGKIVIRLIYDDQQETLGRENMAKDFVRGNAAVWLNGKLGLIDRSGKRLTPFKYTSVPIGWNDPLIYVCVNSSCSISGYVGPDGTEYFEP
ncbi:MAG: WG repeat-containing protein [bacterium]|nr:WG repeat-containing protein [bacterium]